MRVDGEDELAAGALLEHLERLADLIERIDALDDDAKFTGAGKLRETPQLVLCGRRIDVHGGDTARCEALNVRSAEKGRHPTTGADDRSELRQCVLLVDQIDECRDPSGVEIADRVGDATGRIVDRVRRAELSDESLLVGQGGRNDRYPTPSRQLHGKGAYTPGRTDQEQGVALRDVNRVQEIERGSAGKGQGGCLVEIESGGLRHEDEVRARDPLGVRSPLERRHGGDEPKHLVPDREIGDIRSDGLDHACQVAADDRREPVFHRAQQVPVGLVYVEAVDARGADPDEHIAGTNLRLGQRHKARRLLRVLDRISLHRLAAPYKWKLTSDSRMTVAHKWRQVYGYDLTMTREADEVRPLRVDAERNRARVVTAAQAAFAERGLDVPLEDIAARAGVGIATLYRRFPTREDLIAACFETRVAEYATAAEEALEAPDAWSGFCAYVERICAMQAADRGLKGVLTRTFPNAKTLERHRSRGYELSVQLIDRAKTEGSLRPDFAPEDLVLLLMANAGVVEAAGRDAPDAWRRFVGLMLEAFRADRAGPLPPAPSPHQMIRAMRRLGSS